MEPSNATPPGMVCQVCGTTMDQDAVVYCARCATPHHADCWAYAGRCATFGCHGTARTRQPPPPQPDAPLVMADGGPEGLGQKERSLVAGAAPALPGFVEAEGWLEFTVRRLVSLRPPRDAFVFQTRLPVEAAAAALRLRTEPETLLRMPWGEHLDFEGTVGDDGFDVRRIIDYRNSFLPRLTGRFVPLAKGTGVSLRMDLHWAVKVFALVWCSFLGVGFLAGLVAAGTGSMEGLAAMAITAAMICFGASVSVGAFWYEVWRARVLLAETFAATPGSPSPGLAATPSRRADGR